MRVGAGRGKRIELGKVIRLGREEVGERKTDIVMAKMPSWQQQHI